MLPAHLAQSEQEEVANPIGMVDLNVVMRCVVDWRYRASSSTFGPVLLSMGTNFEEACNDSPLSEQYNKTQRAINHATFMRGEPSVAGGWVSDACLIENHVARHVPNRGVSKNFFELLLKPSLQLRRANYNGDGACFEKHYTVPQALIGVVISGRFENSGVEGELVVVTEGNIMDKVRQIFVEIQVLDVKATLDEDTPAPPVWHSNRHDNYLFKPVWVNYPEGCPALRGVPGAILLLWHPGVLSVRVRCHHAVIFGSCITAMAAEHCLTKTVRHCQRVFPMTTCA